MQTQLYKLLGLALMGLGFVNLIALYTSIYHPLLGISLALPVGISLLAWAGFNLWQTLKTDDPELRAEPANSFGESITFLVLILSGIFLGVM